LEAKNELADKKQLGKRNQWKAIRADEKMRRGDGI
jgi:hypothetical protein